MADTDKAKDALAGYLGSLLGSGALAEVIKQRTRIYTFKKTAADSMASDTTAETASPPEPIFANGLAYAVEVTPAAALTGHASNNATITVSKRDADGANKTTVATLTTTASWVAFDATAFTITSANAAVVAGGCLTTEIAKNASGVVVPINTIRVAVVDAG